MSERWPVLWWDCAKIRELRTRIQKPVESEELWAWLVLRRFSIYLSVVLTRVPGLTPNAVTVAAIVMVILTTLWVISPLPVSFVVLALVYNLVYLLDCVDGEMARMKGVVSDEGAWLDRLLQTVWPSMSLALGTRLLAPVVGDQMGLILMILVINVLISTWVGVGSQLDLGANPSAASVSLRKKNKLFDVAVLCLVSDHGLFIMLPAVAAFDAYVPGATVWWFCLHMVGGIAANVWRIMMVRRMARTRSPQKPSQGGSKKVTAVPDAAGGVKAPRRQVYWLVCMGWIYLAAVVALLVLRVLPARTVLALSVAGMPLFVAWAMADYGSFLLAAMASLGFVQIEPSPFDIIALILPVIGVVRSLARPRLGCGSWLLATSVACGLCSMFWWVDVAQGWRFLLITAYLCAMMLYSAGITQPGLIRSFAKGYVISAICASVIGLLALILPEHFRHLLFRTPILSQHRFGYRVMAFFKDPNVFGAFIVPALLVMLDSGSRNMNKAFRVIAPLWCGLVVCCLGVLVSYSRGAALNAMVVITLYLCWVLVRERRGVLRPLVLLALSGIASAVFLTCTGLWPALQLRYRLQAYDSERLRIQETALAMSGTLREIPESATPEPRVSTRGESTHAAPKPEEGSGSVSEPEERSAGPVLPQETETDCRRLRETWLGLGPGQFESHYTRSSHSIYVRLLSEGGIIGAGLFLAGIVMFVVTAARDMRGLRSDSAGLLVLMILTGILVQGATIDILHWRHFWLLLGFLLSAARWRIEDVCGNALGASHDTSRGALNRSALAPSSTPTG